METANTDNVAETPFPQNSNPRTGPKTIESVARELVAAIVAKVQEGIEPVEQSVQEVAEEVIESNDFENRVNELAYGQAEDFICDFDISDKVEECLEYRDWEDTVGSLVDTSVEQALSESEFASKEYVASVETALEERLDSIEEGLADKPCILHDSALEAIERSLVEIKAAGEERNDLLAGVHARLDELEQVTASKFGQLDNIQIAFRGIVETMFAR